MLISSEAEIIMEARDYFGYTVFEDGTILNKRIPHKIKRPNRNNQGYLFVSLRIDNKQKVKSVHRLVAECFLPNPDGFTEVDHLDADKDNNHYSNLEWTTRSENIRRTYERNGRSATGINNARCITEEHVVHEICSLLQEGYSSAQIRDRGYNYSLVRKIKGRSNWTCISTHYNF